MDSSISTWFLSLKENKKEKKKKEMLILNLNGVPE